MHRFLIIIVVIALSLFFVSSSFSESQEVTSRDKAVYCSDCRTQCITNEVKLQYPLQAEFNRSGYHLLMGIFVATFLLIRFFSYINKKEINKIGYAMTTLLSLGFVIIFQVAFESWMYHTYYISILSNQPMVLINLLFFIWVTLGIIVFVYKIVWSLYRFHTKGEISEFLWWVMRTADEIKRETRL